MPLLVASLLVFAAGTAGVARADGVPAERGAASVEGPFQVRNTFSGKCLTNPAMSHTAGQGMIQWTCDGISDDQLWYVEGWAPGPYLIRNLESSQCLAVPGGSPQNGLQLIQWPCDGHRDQYWHIDGGVLENLVTHQQAGLGPGSGNGVAVVQNYPCGCRDQFWTMGKPV